MNRRQRAERMVEREASQVCPAIEKYITIGELAERLALSEETVRRIVMKEPGVLCIERKRKTLYRIPESVAERIVRRSTILAAG